MTVDEQGTEIAGGQISDYVNENNEIILYPKYIAEKYTIYFDYLSQTCSQELYFGDIITYPINTSSISAFYIVDGWYDKDKTDVKFVEVSCPDLTLND